MPHSVDLPTRHAATFLARLHRSLATGSVVRLGLPERLSPERAHELLEGGGFEAIVLGRRDACGTRMARARRARSLPDWVRPGLDLLICGLNPSLYAADQGVPFGRPGNRFWPAALLAGLVELDRDPFAALARGVGFTDCVKRATRRANELTGEEYQHGVARVQRLVRRYRPKSVCFVGLDGFRRALDPQATPGWRSARFGARPAYLMPSTSGLNAHADLADLTRHLARARRGP